MKIVICDDDILFIDQITKYIEQYEKKYLLGIIKYIFTDNEEMYEFFQDTSDIDLIFLDVLFEHSNGMQTARKIRTLNHRVSIIFISQLKDFAIEGYEVNADGYLLKPIDYSVFESKMESIINKLRKEEDRFFFDTTDKGKVLFRFYEITYIETYSRRVKIHTRIDELIGYKKMKDYEKILEDYGFARCHAAYIVNMQYIHRINGLILTLKDGTEIPISKTRKKGFMKLFTKFIGMKFNNWNISDN